MLWWLAVLIAQTPQEQAARVRAQMQPALDAQRASIRTQATVAHPGVWASRAPVRRASIMAISAPPPSPPPLCEALAQPEIATLVDSAAEANNLNPMLIREVARQESGFRPCALSTQGAMGVMQLMPDTQAQFGVANPWDPRQSIEAGSRLLRQLLDRYHGDVSMALSAYNAGTARVDQSGGVPRIPETKNYVDSILYRLLPGSAGGLAGTAAAPLFGQSLLLEGP